ncbi:MAG: neutral/alkaline non-lysosomal ceramidase N-terminal domain-containing protein [Planctomycetia bacterium]|nr:neutral/alkaline non-lysosomal ceramidase N-terminal domain-containing protein [Planctomycetia bacterium]
MPHIDFPQNYCQGATARRDITPPVGIYHRMWGAASHDRSTGIHRPLLATALALSDSSNSQEIRAKSDTQVLVSIDHCLLWNEQMDALRAAVCRNADLEIEQLQITFSHTHAAGLMDPARADLPGGELIAPYLELLAEKVTEAVREAMRSLRPVRIVYGGGRCGLARNRDLWDETSEQFVCGLNPAGPTDDTVLVARITDERCQTVATVVNYACHPTTLAWDNSLISPDFVGAMRELVESATGAPCVFLQGASGDLGPRHGFVGDVAVADRNGRELGYAALASLTSLPAPGLRFIYTGPVVSGATIGTWDYIPLSAEELCQKRLWRPRHFHVELPYRTDLPTRAETQAELARWHAEEQSARQRGDQERARDCRAQAERMARQLARLRSLPPGKTLPLAVTVSQLGDAFWVMLEGEHYNLLQRALRQRFPDRLIIVATLTGGWRPGYLPTAETYGKGIYQESIAIVAPGSLELLIEAIGDKIAETVG